jgi:hypothetical protein
MTSIKIAFLLAAPLLLGIACITPTVENDLETLEAEEEIVAAGSKCSCNAPPDSTGKWSVDTQTCSNCSTSGDCSTATCFYKHSVSQAISRNVGCHFHHNSIVVVGEAEVGKYDAVE